MCMQAARHAVRRELNFTLTAVRTLNSSEERYRSIDTLSLPIFMRCARRYLTPWTTKYVITEAYSRDISTTQDFHVFFGARGMCRWPMLRSNCSGSQGLPYFFTDGNLEGNECGCAIRDQNWKIFEGILNSFSNSFLEFYSYEGFSSSDIRKNEA